MAYIVIDPGHGGKDPGAIGFKINEKDVVLNLAKKLNDHLGQYEKAVVSLTRWDDRFLELSERAKFANDRPTALNRSSMLTPALQPRGIRLFSMNKL
jgi:N-acetylmuramoyl-L-alanine amidase